MPHPVLINGGTSAEWNLENPILPVNVTGTESDTGKYKIGNGSSFWNSLKYVNDLEKHYWKNSVDDSHKSTDLIPEQAGKGIFAWQDTGALVYCDGTTFTALSNELEALAYSALPTASTVTKKKVWCTDYQGGSYAYSDGVKWIFTGKQLPSSNFEFNITNFTSGWAGIGSTVVITSGIAEITSTVNGTAYFRKSSGFPASGLKSTTANLRIRITSGTLTGYKVAATVDGAVEFAATDLVFPALNSWVDISKFLPFDGKVTIFDIKKTGAIIGDKFEIASLNFSDSDPYPDFSPEAHRLGGAAKVPQMFTRTIKTSGGNYADIATALAAITDNSKYRQYTLILYPGTYAGNFTMLPFVHLRGMDRETCIIDLNQAADTALASISANSTINLNVDATIENLTISITNGRYAIHSDDATYKNSVKTLRNCKIVHNGNDTARAYWIGQGQLGTAVHIGERSLGCGGASGEVLTIEDCELIATDAALAWHNNSSFVNPAIVNLIRSSFTSTLPVGDTYRPEAGTAVQLNSIRGGMLNLVRAEDCLFNGIIKHTDAGGTWTSETTHAWIKFIAQACGKYLFKNVSALPADAGYKDVNFDADVTLHNTSGGAITRGMAIAYNTTYKNCRPMTSSDDITLFAGIALEDIADTALGKTRKTGFEDNDFLLKDGTVDGTFSATYIVSNTTPGAFKSGTGSAIIGIGTGNGVVKY